MTRLKLGVRNAGAAAGSKVVAQLSVRPDKGKPTRQTMLLELNRDQSIEVPPGQVLMQVQLPSGELWTGERTVTGDREAELVCTMEPSRQEWLGWQQLMTPNLAQQAAPPRILRGQVPTRAPEPPLVKELRVHRGGSALAIGLDAPVQDGGARYAVDADDRATSLAIERYRGAPPLVEILRGDGAREVVVAPLPWPGEHEEPLAIQIVLERTPDGARGNVVIHDPVFAPVLGYYAGGNRAAAEAMADDIERRAMEALRGKLQNPVAAAAGTLVLRRMHRTRLPLDWIRNLGDIRDLSDGAILHAAVLLGTKGVADPARVRARCLEAVARGVPVFAECGRLLRDALRRVAAAEQEGGGATSKEVAAALAWARALVEACRPESIITWLVGDDAALARLVPEVVPPAAPR